MARRIFILGGGRFGVHLASRLSEFGCEVTIGDSDPDRVQDLSDDGFNAVELEADDVRALKAAGVATADVVVVAIGENMQASILATLAMKEFKAPRLVCRADDVRHAQVLARLGADLVVLPSRDTAYRLAERLVLSSFKERFPIAGDYQMAHVRCGNSLAGKSIQDADLPRRYHVTAALVNRPDPDGQLQPVDADPDLVLSEADVLMVVGARDRLDAFEKATRD